MFLIWMPGNSNKILKITEWFILFFPVDQRLDLNKLGPNDNDTVRGQIVGKRNVASFSYQNKSSNSVDVHVFFYICVPFKY